MGLSVTQGTPTTFTVSWSAPPFDPIVGYRVTYGITGIAVEAVAELSASELQWSSPPLDESRTYDITVAVQTLSDSFPSAPESAPIPQSKTNLCLHFDLYQPCLFYWFVVLSDMFTVPSGPVSSLEGSPSLSQITVSWD